MSRSIKAIFSAMSLTLCASIALTLPVEAVATTLPQEEKLYSSFDNVQGSSEIVADILTELKDERTANTKKFLLEDGTKMIAEYDLPVHFKNDKGNWVEYDNRLVAENSTSTADEATSEYSNKNSNIDIKLSNKAKSNNMIKVSSDDYSISWGYDSISKSRAEIIENTDKLVGNDKFTTLKNLTQEAKYCDVYENIDLQYFVSSTGIKENIILKNSDVQNEFNITYKIKNLTAKQTDDYSITLYNKSGKAVYTIIAPYMMDAKGILLDPELIFCEKGMYYFCYYPEQEMTLAEAFHKLTEYMVREVDYRDEKGVHLAYVMHKATMEENYSIEQIMDEFLEERKELTEVTYKRCEEELDETAPMVAEKGSVWTPLKKFLKNHIL